MLMTPTRFWPLGTLALLSLVGLHAPSHAAECTTRSETVCRIDCAEGTLHLACPPGKTRCAGRCTTGASRDRVAQCRSGSGSRCLVSCDRGTQSLACPKTTKRCAGRCASVSAKSVDLEPTSTGIQPAHHFGRKGLEPEVAERYFQQLVSDVYWATGVRDKPSAIAIELWEALDDVERGKKRSSVLDETLGGERVELHVGLKPRQMMRLREGLASFVDGLRLEESARQQLDQEVEALTRSILFENATVNDPPEPMPLTVQNRNCEGPQTFQVSSETPWIRFQGDTTFSGLRPGQRDSVQVGFDLAGVEPGRHQGRIVIECLTCPAQCRVDRSQVDVYVEVAEPVD